jgi:hypothetical protein
MTRFKDFGSGQSLAVEPISFKLHGEEFNCRPRIQGKALLGLVADSNSDDATVSTQVLIKFFDDALTPESKERFDKLLEDPERIVTVETLGEITGWLIQEYSDRPETQPEAS